MIQIRHVLARYFLYRIWYVQLCGRCNFGQRYTSALLRMSILHPVKQCASTAQAYLYHRDPKINKSYGI